MVNELNLSIAGQISSTINHYGQVFSIPVSISTGAVPVDFRSCTGEIRIDSKLHKNGFNLPIIGMKSYEVTKLKINFEMRENYNKIQHVLDKYTAEIKKFALSISDKVGAEVKFRRFAIELTEKFSIEFKSVIFCPTEVFLRIDIGYYVNQLRKEKISKFEFPNLSLS
ncbi:hypothetical protein D6810_03065, partial [Candidatus Dojkabacteria bacterium]